MLYPLHYFQFFSPWIVNASHSHDHEPYKELKKLSTLSFSLTHLWSLIKSIRNASGHVCLDQNECKKQLIFLWGSIFLPFFCRFVFYIKFLGIFSPASPAASFYFVIIGASSFPNKTGWIRLKYPDRQTARQKRWRFIYHSKICSPDKMIQNKWEEKMEKSIEMIMKWNAASYSCHEQFFILR